MKSTYHKWLEKHYREKCLPTYLAFISVYPFQLEDLKDEIWKDIKDYEGLYQVSNFGSVKSFNGRWNNVQILKPSLQKNGYLTVSLRRKGTLKTSKILRLVAEAFLPNPDNLPEVNRIDDNKLNNCVENLE